MPDEKPSKYVARTHVWTVLVLFYFAFGSISYALSIVLNWLGLIDMPSQSFIMTGNIGGNQTLTSLVGITGTVIYMWLGVWISARYFVNNIRFANKNEVTNTAARYYAILVVVVTLITLLPFFVSQQASTEQLFALISSIIRSATAVALFYFFSKKYISSYAVSDTGAMVTEEVFKKRVLPKWFIAIVILAFLVSVGGTVQQSMRSFEAVKQEVEVKTQETLAGMEKQRELDRQTRKDAGTINMLQYNFDVWGVSFAYPASWKELKPDFGNGGSYTFIANSDNPNTSGRLYDYVVYNQPTNSFVYVEKGNEEIWTNEGNINFTSTIKTRSADGSMRALYEMPRSLVELNGIISSISLSPRADYVLFDIKTLQGNKWTLDSNVILEVATGRNVLDDSLIQYDGIYGNIVWNNEGTKVIVQNGGTSISGGDAVYASIDWPIKGFKKIFELTEEEYDSGLGIYLVNYGSQIQILVTTDKYYATRPPDQTQIKAKYRYSFEGDSLTEL